LKLLAIRDERCRRIAGHSYHAAEDRSPSSLRDPPAAMRRCTRSTRLSSIRPTAFAPPNIELTTIAMVLLGGWGRARSSRPVRWPLSVSNEALCGRINPQFYLASVVVIVLLAVLFTPRGWSISASKVAVAGGAAVVSGARRSRVRRHDRTILAVDQVSKRFAGRFALDCRQHRRGARSMTASSVRTASGKSTGSTSLPCTLRPRQGRVAVDCRDNHPVLFCGRLGGFGVRRSRFHISRCSRK